MSDNNDLRLFITQCYREILNREPDIISFEFYFRKIQNKEISQDQLPAIFLESVEYKEIQRKKREFDINYFEKKIYSQNGEDEILEFIFSIIGTTNKFFVEIGVGDGSECNTRYLLEKRWDGVMIDVDSPQSSFIKKEFVTAENINELLGKYSVPVSFDLLSIDVDYNTYWIWEAIRGYCPNVVSIEYNSTIPYNESLVVKYDQMGRWDLTNYFGASLLALSKLGKSKGYTLVGCESKGINAFFIRNELIEGKIEMRDIKDLYRPPGFGFIVNGVYIGYSPSNKSMITV